MQTNLIWLIIWLFIASMVAEDFNKHFSRGAQSANCKPAPEWAKHAEICWERE